MFNFADLLLQHLPPNIVAELFGATALFCALYATTRTQDEHLIYWAAAASFFLIPHYYLLGDVFTAFSMLIIFTRCLCARWFRHKMMMVVFLTLIVAQTLFLYQSWHNLLPATATALATINYFCFTGIKMRLLFCLSSSLLITNALLLGSYSVLIIEMIGISLHLLTIYRIKNINSQPY